MLKHEEIEIPRKQTFWYFQIDETTGDDYAIVLRRWIQDTEIDIEKVNVVSDLCCGNGLLTAGSLALFKQAEIHAVDFHADVLNPVLKDDPRVKFHQGFIVDVLASGQLPPADLVILSFANRLHGLNKDNIHLLKNHVKGLLMTVGDNCGLEIQPWFRDSFQPVKLADEVDGSFWKPK